VHRYQTEEISLVKTASLAGVSWAQMVDFLLKRGVQPRLGAETQEEAARKSGPCEITSRLNYECDRAPHGDLNCASIGQLNPLRQLFGTLYIPMEVYDEIRIGLEEGYLFYALSSN
jgi:hypothetical protein